LERWICVDDVEPSLRRFGTKRKLSLLERGHPLSGRAARVVSMIASATRPEQIAHS
jgi:hypothetical protein